MGFSIGRRNRGLRAGYFFHAAPVALVGLGVTCAVPAVAQVAQSSDLQAQAVTGVGDIVVTESKRSERLIDVPSSVSAVTGADLEKRNLLQVQDFAAQIPALSFQPVGNSGTRVILRGLNSGGAGATVATLVDDTALSYSSSLSTGAFDIANLDTYDLERIEVLRGPQGTLYGAAAEGGLIKYVTNPPNLTKIQAGLQAEAEGVDQGGIGATGKGFINLPVINDRLALRLTGFYKDIEGYIDNPLLGLKDADGGRRYGGRAQLLWQATDDFTVRLTAARQWQRLNDNGLVQVVGANTSPNDPPANQFDLIAGGRLQQNTANPNASRSDTQNYSMSLKYGTGFADFFSSTSFGRINVALRQDISSINVVPGVTLAQVFGGAYGQPINIYGASGNRNNLSKFNQEFRVSSKPDTDIFGVRVDAQAGVFYSHENITFDQFYDARSDATGAVLTTPAPLGGSRLPAKYEEISGYADFTVHFTPKFDIEAGGRYTSNQQTAQVFNFAGLLNGPADVVNPRIDTHETKFTYSVAPRYHFSDDFMVYARIASGYRPGGPEHPVPGAPADLPTTYKADSTVNYETGLKGAFFDKAVSVDIAAFYIDWKDIQINTLVSSQTTGQVFAITGNAGQAVSRGVEWSLSYTPFHGLTISDVGSYVDAHLTQDAPGLGGKDGDALAYVPDWSNTANIDYGWTAFGGRRAFVGVSWSYVGTRYTGFTASPATANHVKLPTYSTFNAQIGMNSGRYRLEIFASNLTNKRGLTDYSSGNGYDLTGTAQIIQPRTIGIRLGFGY
jgi:outer membrane receptor protein involved in Fe transport